MSREDGKRFKLAAVLDRYKFVIAAAILGALLLLWPWNETEEEISADVQPSTQQWEVRELEDRMEQILSKISGVGRVDVMLTLESGGELVLATDSNLRYSGSPQNPENYDRSSETVTISGGNGTDVVVTQERSAKFRGALIVCEGGDNDKVRLKIMEAVCALTGLGSDRVAVVRWGNESSTASTTADSEEDLS